MASEVEAAGAAITAGLTATLIDGMPAKGKGAPSGPCPNCGAERSGNYCARCGQPVHIHASLGQMVADILRDLFHFDTRAWKTLPSLLFRPGTLTHDYIAGHRARFISPLAMFLLAVFAMFFVFSFVGGKHVDLVGKDGHIDLGNAGVAAAEANVERAQTALDAASAQNVGADDVARLREKSDAATKELERLRAALANAKIGGNSPADEISKGVNNGDIKIQTGWALLDDKLSQSLQNPQLTLYKIQDAASKYAFLLAPISLPFVWLLFFWKRGVTLFNHTVYILYSLSFVATLFVVFSLLSTVPWLDDWLAPWLLLAGVAHEFFHLKGGYRLGWFSAIWRLPFLMASAGVSFILFCVAVILLGVVA
jgi:Protein of unknown function (DUF3667)